MMRDTKKPSSFAYGDWVIGPRGELERLHRQVVTNRLGMAILFALEALHLVLEYVR